MDIKQAKAFIEYLHKNDLMFHFDDCAVECLYRNGACSLGDAIAIQVEVDEIYAADLDWGEFECPIGYALHLMKL